VAARSKLCEDGFCRFEPRRRLAFLAVGVLPPSRTTSHVKACSYYRIRSKTPCEWTSSPDVCTTTPTAGCLLEVLELQHQQPVVVHAASRRRSEVNASDVGSDLHGRVRVVLAIARGKPARVTQASGSITHVQAERVCRRSSGSPMPAPR